MSLHRHGSTGRSVLLRPSRGSIEVRDLKGRGGLCRSCAVKSNAWWWIHDEHSVLSCQTYGTYCHPARSQGTESLCYEGAQASFDAYTEPVNYSNRFFP